MRITLTTTDTAMVFMRRAGYGFQKEDGGEVAFVRRFGGGLFPRYHAYVQEQPGQLTVNLHIDQKAPTYERGRAHSGEYEGPLVAEEAARLRGLAQSHAGVPPATSGAPTERRKGFLERWFS